MISNRPRARVQILVKQKYRAIIKYNYSFIQVVSILLNRCYLNLLSKPYVAARIMSHYVFLNFIIFFLFFLISSSFSCFSQVFLLETQLTVTSPRSESDLEDDDNRSYIFVIAPLGEKTKEEKIR